MAAIKHSDQPAIKPNRLTPHKVALPHAVAAMAALDNTPTACSVNRQHSRSGSLDLSKAIKRGWGVVHEQHLIRPWKRRIMILHRECLNFFDSDDDEVLHSVHVNDIVRMSRVRATTYPTCEIRFRPSDASTSPGEKVKLDLLVLHIRLPSDEHLQCWLNNMSPLCPQIRGVSRPSSFVHRRRIAFDWDTCSFINMPPEWIALLNRTRLKPADYAKDPQAILNYIDIYNSLVEDCEDSKEWFRMQPLVLAEILDRAYACSSRSKPRKRPPRVRPPETFKKPDAAPKRLQPLRKAPPPPKRRPNQATLGRAAAEHVANPDHVSEVFIPSQYRRQLSLGL